MFFGTAEKCQDLDVFLRIRGSDALAATACHRKLNFFSAKAGRRFNFLSLSQFFCSLRHSVETIVASGEDLFALIILISARC
jgi:hypothetical protein